MKKECIAMILAGGNGTRLGSLTDLIPKPMVHFGDSYRIIDFTLSNCAHSGVDTLGVLTQYRALALHDYIGDGRPWRLDRAEGGVHMLPSSATGTPYMGTADAVYQNIGFIERFNPEYVLILSGDHIYKMDYGKMIASHKEANADATIAVIPVPWEEASRFGIICAAEDGAITGFAEKPCVPKSNLASMGVYVFSWSLLKKFLIADEKYSGSQRDFGKNIIPSMLTFGKRLHAYRFNDYWRDVGAVQSLWESNMDLIQDSPKISLRDKTWEIFTKTHPYPPRYISDKAEVRNSMIANGCKVSRGSQVIDSIIMPGVSIGKNARIRKAIIGVNAIIGEGAEIGADDGLDVFCDNTICSKDISLIGPGVSIDKNVIIHKNSHVDINLLPQERWPIAVMNTESPRLELVHV